MNQPLHTTARLTTALALAFSVLPPAGARAAIPPAAVAATQSAALVNDVDGDGLADPGDTLRYTAVVSNTGGVTATGVAFTETLDDNTSPTGLLRASPIAAGDLYTAGNVTPLVVAAGAGLLSNDFGVPGPSAVVTSTATAQGGTASISADGAFTYTAAPGFSGTDTFTYTISNVLGDDTGLVTLTVWALPQAQPESYTALLDTPLNVAAAAGVLTNDTVSGATLTAYAATSAQGGSVALNTDGSFSYTPAGGFFSPPVDTFTYTLVNPVGSSTGTVSITVDLPGPPLAVTDTYTATANTPLTFAADGVLTNDTLSGAVIDAYAATTDEGGSVVLAPTGAFTYTPPADFVSPPTDAFTYTLRNALGASTATVNVVVVPAGAPIAAADAFTTTANLTFTVGAGSGLLANDTLQLATLSPLTTTTALGGLVEIDPDGAFVYLPPTDTISPPADTFTYTLTNALGASTATVTLTINPPAAPSVADDAYTATADTDLVINAAGGALFNDTLNFGAIADYAATTTRGGSVVLAASGAFTYTPPAGLVSPPVDAFTYTVANPLGDATATVRITINPPGAPLTAGESYTATVNTDLVVAAGSGLFANDTLRYGTLADYAATTVRGGSVDLAPTGAFTYTPPIDTVSPPTDTFTYTVTNTLGTSTSTVTLTIAPEGAPSATTDTYTATANTPLVVVAGSGLFANDTVHFATLTGYAATTARGGSVDLAPTGAFTYTPPVDTISPPTDTFTYTLSNLLGASTGTVTLTIDPPAPPVAAGDAYTATVNVATGVVAPGVLGNDTLNFGTLSAYAATSAQGGTVSLAPNGAFTYTSALNFLGTDTYTYTLSNVLGASTATVTVTVLPPPPDAVNDAYATTGNVDLSVGAGSGVLGNDSVNFGTLTGASTASANGGGVTVNADGSFSYNPPTGFTGTDTFTYTVGNATAADTATVTVTVSQRVWFVDNTATAGGDGRHSAPFDTLAEAQTASSANDYIYVYYGDGTATGQNAGITLKAGQRLLGQHAALVVNSTTIEPAVPGDLPLIVAGSGDAVTAPTGVGVEVRGLRLTSGTSGDALGLTTSGSANAGLTISDNVFSAPSNSGVDITHNGSGTLTLSLSNNTFSGGAPALRITRNVGTVYITDFSNTVVSSSATEGMQLSNVVFDATPGGTYAVVNGGTTMLGVPGNPVNGSGLTLSNVSGDLAFTDLDIFASGAALSGSGSGSFATNSGFRLTIGAGVANLSAGGGPAVSLSSATLNLPLHTLTSSGSPTTGVALTNIDGTFTAGSGSSITNATGTDFFVDGGSGTVTYNGTITNSSGRSVAVQNRTSGTITLTGAISDTGTGVQLLNNTGATVAFSGGLTLNTGANAAFAATGGGTVTVTGSTNTLQTTTGTALNVANTTIGAAGLTFRSVSSNGAVNGIVLNTTGASGGLTVSGTGSPASGGTIQNAIGAGISLTSVTGVSLAYLNITNGGDDGVFASGVANFSLSHATVSGNGNSVTDEGLELDNVTGTLTLDTVTVTGSAHNNVWVDNTSGTLTAFTVTNGAYQNTSAVSGAHGLLLTARGTAAVGAVSISGASITGNFGTGVFIDAADTATISDALIQNVTLTANANALTLSQSGSAAQNFRVLNNTLIGAQTHAINVYSSGTATGGSINGRIVGNTIGSAGTAGSGSATGDGIRARIQAQTNGVLLIDNNVIRQTPNGNGIEVVGGSDSLDVTLTGNNVDPQATSGSPLAAIYVTSANPTGSQNGFVRSDVTGNTVSTLMNSIDGGGEYLVLVEESGTTLQLRNTTSAPDATTQLDNANTGSAGAYSMDNDVDLIGTPIGLPPLLAADGQGPGAEAATAAQFEAVRAEAADLWAAAGHDVAGLSTARLVVADLPEGRLAEADADARTLTLDVDAAGWGWSFDDTPAEGRVDAVTVVAHELGHLLGFEHAETGVMAEALARGKRVTPAPALDAAAGGAVGVVIGALPAGRSVTIVFDVIVSDPVAGGAATVSNQGTVAGANFAAFVTDDPATPAVNDATVTALDLGRFLYLPVIQRNYTPRPDLTVTVSLSPNTTTFAAADPVLITVVVTNIGEVPAAGFWVDAYLNPTTAPTAANQIWNERCGLTPCYGLAWSVTQSLAPGQSLTLISTPGGPYADNTIWPGHFAAGTTDLYVYADSYSDDGGPTGQIPELNESNNRAELHGLSVTGDAPAETTDASRVPGR